jgi:hypothetical protein
MAEEIRVNLTLQYEDTEGTTEHIQVNDFLADIASFQFTKAKQSIGTSEEAIVLGGVTSPRWFMAVNRDDTNYVELKVATSGAIFARLYPGACCIVPLGSGAQAPYAIANTAACLLEYFVGNAT